MSLLPLNQCSNGSTSRTKRQKGYFIRP
uniref:Uncharacterized protein n=1 Tax=Rhizophora mucronata TaxID=61149 RepID=A0A2P2NM30_RHIMU